MEASEISLSKEGNAKSGDGFIDRSRVRILLCDNNSKSSKEVFTLLIKCSYQVTLVRSPRQVIGALNAEGPDIDIILTELDFPMAKGLKMLKYITRDKELQRIPVIMMSAQDEVSIVVKCLKFGAADFLVKPLRTNELLNLWTHMWRRRQMLGLAEKIILNFDLVASDLSDVNTNSTTMFSDDTDDKSQKNSILEMNGTSAAAPEETLPSASFPCWPNPGISEQWTGQTSSFPKKSPLKIGRSSAFFTYPKPCVLKSNSLGLARVDDDAPHCSKIDKKQVYTQTYINGETGESCLEGYDVSSNSCKLQTLSAERSCVPASAMEFSQQMISMAKDFSQANMNRHGHNYPYYVSGITNQVVMPSLTQEYQMNLQNHAASAMLSQYNHSPHQWHHHVPGMASVPYYLFGMCFQPSQMPMHNPWPSYGNSSFTDGKSSKIDHREAALMKFRKKRKERCFDKKIRYDKRKRIAEGRPRVRGQFVRNINGINVDLNGQPVSVDDDEEEEDEEAEDRTARDSSEDDDA